jgi:hypothetical protein
MKAQSKPAHYYASYRKGKYSNRAPELVYEYLEDLVLDAFVCKFSENMVFHLYCCSEGLAAVRRHLRLHYGPTYSCTRYPLHDKEYVNFLAKYYSLEYADKIAAKMRKIDIAYENKSKQISLLPGV